jgi:DNA-binding transcriptional LysR family regulator
VEPHLLRTFLTVCETRSFSAAATRLGYTQSAVSQHIASLEADLGAPLLTRRPVATTEAGRRLREHAGPILLRLAAARADVARSVTRPTRLGLGLTPLSLVRQVPAALASLRDGPTLLTAEVTVRGPAEIAARVATASLDAGLIDGYATPSDPLRLPEPLSATGSTRPGGPVRVIAVAEEPAVVALPPSHPLAGRSSLALADLADAYWIDAPGITGLPGIRAAAGLDALRAGLRYDGCDLATLHALVAAGQGLTLLPASRLDPALSGVPVSAPRLVHRVELLHDAAATATDPAGRLATLLTP